MNHIISWMIGFAVLAMRWTCRVRYHNDLREKLREQGTSYVFAGLHAQQAAAVVASEPGTCAMVSRSVDGQLLVPALKLCRCTPVRGSGGRVSKGGASALRELVDQVSNGRPAFLAVDGPRGPRGKVHPGVALLSQKTGAAVLPSVGKPRVRLIIRQTWDRLQIPIPFSRIDVVFGDPLFPQKDESAQDFAARIQAALAELERELDPAEAASQEDSGPSPGVTSRRKAA